MVDVFRILRFATTYEQQTQTDQSAGLLNFLWDGNPPASSQVAAPATGLAAQPGMVGQVGQTQPTQMTPEQKGSYRGPILQPGTSPKRQQIVSIAASQIGKDDWRQYMQGTTEQIPKEKPHWCGIFAMWVYQKAGLLTGQKWDFHGGGMSRFLKQIPAEEAKPGDLAYFNENNHHAIVESIDVANNKMTTIDGNTAGKQGGQPNYSMVYRKTSRSPSDVAAFYSIGPLLGEQ